MIREFQPVQGCPVDAADAPRRHARYFATQTRAGTSSHGGATGTLHDVTQKEADNIRCQSGVGVQQADERPAGRFSRASCFLRYPGTISGMRVELTGQALEALQSRNPGSAKAQCLLGLHAVFASVWRV